MEDLTPEQFAALEAEEAENNELVRKMHEGTAARLALEAKLGSSRTSGVPADARKDAERELDQRIADGDNTSADAVARIAEIRARYRRPAKRGTTIVTTITTTTTRTEEV